jgi:hypothetical protein
MIKLISKIKMSPKKMIKIISQKSHYQKNYLHKMEVKKIKNERNNIIFYLNLSN